jgi:nitroimidazol reductase NimA-like FMN-containing flavoprotein (pyridoxamine 5'-phosphate oxidase superfamily)
VERHPTGGRARFEVLSEQQCRDLLDRHDVGRVAFVSDRFPVVVPVNYALAGETIVVRTGPGLLSEGVPGQPVAFEVDGFERWNRSGWSVLVQGLGGNITEAVDDESVELRDSDIDTWVPGDKTVSLTIEIARLSGRRIVRTMGTSTSRYE